MKHQDEAGILRSRDYFNTLIKEEIDKGIKPSRIVLGGFSQGGAMSLFTGVTNTLKLGGIFGLSSYMLLTDRLKNHTPSGELPNKETPFFLAHGTDDGIVQYDLGKKTEEFLKKELGLNVEFHTYPYVPLAPHSVMFDFLLTAAVALAIPPIRRKSRTWRPSSRRPSPRRETARRRQVYDWVKPMQQQCQQQRRRGSCHRQYS